ncbi:hypothetical protein TNCV_286681 [Trichonephila clavipes]|nr:hypothetical protein TNCV_286681 [Trichonephila clavipes]
MFKSVFGGTAPWWRYMLVYGSVKSDIGSNAILRYNRPDIHQLLLQVCDIWGCPNLVSYHVWWKLSQVTTAHGSSTVTESLQSVSSVLEKMRPIPKLITTSGNRGRHKNLSKDLTSAESLTSTKSGQNREKQQVPTNTIHPVFVLSVILNIMIKIKDGMMQSCNGCGPSRALGPPQCGGVRYATGKILGKPTPLETNRKKAPRQKEMAPRETENGDK